MGHKCLVFGQNLHLLCISGPTFEVSKFVLAHMQYLSQLIRFWYLSHWLINPLYSNGFSHTDKYNKVGIIHNIFYGSHVEISKLCCTSVSEDHFCLSPDEILHLAAFHLEFLCFSKFSWPNSIKDIIAHRHKSKDIDLVAGQN